MKKLFMGLLVLLVAGGLMANELPDSARTKKRS